MASLQEMTRNGGVQYCNYSLLHIHVNQTPRQTTAEIDGPRRPCGALKCKYDDEALAHCSSITAAIQREDDHKTQRRFVTFKVILVLFVPNNTE